MLLASSEGRGGRGLGGGRAAAAASGWGSWSLVTGAEQLVRRLPAACAGGPSSNVMAAPVPWLPHACTRQPRSPRPRLSQLPPPGAGRLPHGSLHAAAAAAAAAWAPGCWPGAGAAGLAWGC
jgi:hypothetical protein